METPGAASNHAYAASNHAYAATDHACTASDHASSAIASDEPLNSLDDAAIDFDQVFNKFAYPAGDHRLAAQQIC